MWRNLNYEVYTVYSFEMGEFSCYSAVGISFNLSLLAEATIKKVVLVILVNQEQTDFLTDISYCHFYCCCCYLRQGLIM